MIINSEFLPTYRRYQWNSIVDFLFDILAENLGSWRGFGRMSARTTVFGVSVYFSVVYTFHRVYFTNIFRYAFYTLISLLC